MGQGQKGQIARGEDLVAKMRFTVTLDAPEGITREEVAWYIQEAVATWKGCKDPYNDPIFDLEGDSVVVRDELTKEIYRDDGNE